MFSHIFVSVSDFARALDFYKQVLSQLGIKQRFCEPDKPWAGWHSAGNARPYFVICHPFDGKAHDQGNGQMVAFTAADREQVRSAYKTALALGGRCEGEPGLRPQYHEHYYGAYFRDLDGNKVCVACHKPESISEKPKAADTLRILAVSGSMRATSINTAFLLALTHVMPSNVRITVYEELNLLPFFNPDLESNPPEQALRWRDHVAKADALLIASPEYAHGVTGAMKNALDWLVSHEPFVNKPVAVVNTSDRARHADAALRETLITMNAHLVESASITVPLLGTQLNLDELPGTKLVSDAATTISEALLHAVQTHPKPAYSLDDLMQWLKVEFELVPEPAHSGTWRNMFYKTVDRHPATTTRVLKILTDAKGSPQKLQPCSDSDNNNSILMDIPIDLNLLRPLVENEIRSIINRLSH